jgi:hypothetical protein
MSFIHLGSYNTTVSNAVSQLLFCGSPSLSYFFTIFSYSCHIHLTSPFHSSHPFPKYTWPSFSQSRLSRHYIYIVATSVKPVTIMWFTQLVLHYSIVTHPVNDYYSTVTHFSWQICLLTHHNNPVFHSAS